MSQAMNQKTATKNKKSKKSRLPDTEIPEQLSGAEQMFENVRPHLTTIALVVVAGMLGFIAIAFMARSRFDQEAAQWRGLATASTIAIRTGDISALKSVADDFQDTKAGLWALQMAGDQQLRMGIEQLSVDRVAGNQLIEKAKASFQQIVDAPKTTKTTMLDRRSHFSLAYAYESLGQLDKANLLYEELVDLAPESAFANLASRGVERTSNPAYKSLYTKFANFEEEVIGDAPGPAIIDRPVIEFPDALPAGQKPPAESEPPVTGSGDFVPATKTPEANADTSDKVEPATEPAKTGEDTAVESTPEVESPPVAKADDKNTEAKPDEENKEENKDDKEKDKEEDK